MTELPLASCLLTSSISVLVWTWSQTVTLPMKMTSPMASPHLTPSQRTPLLLLLVCCDGLQTVTPPPPSSILPGPESSELLSSSL